MAVTTGTIVASAARTTTGSGAAVAVNPTSAVGQVGLSVNVTAASGTTPSMTLSVEWSPDGTNFGAADVADAFTAITTTAVRSKVFAVKAPFYRVTWTITGTTPSFTFTVTEVQY